MTTVEWLLDSPEPWTRYRTLIDVLERPEDDPAVIEARSDIIDDCDVQRLVDTAATWPGYPLRRHNDAAHPLYAIATLADFGLHREDPGVEPIVEALLSRFDGAAFETLLWLPRFLTKEEDADRWSWMLCDAPTLLYALLAFGAATDLRVEQATAALVGSASDGGWQCRAASSLSKFSGPGRRDDPCPMATVYALKALSLVPGAHASDPVGAGIEAILSHWEHQQDYKLKMFGIGTDFRKLKYPFVWYDILHVAEVLSRFDAARCDQRLRAMVDEILGQADEEGRFTAASMYRAWTRWSFADKKAPSPWLTMVVLRIQHRMVS